ncbi:hypothetical protein ANI02nite_28970 [Acetobacter nitrogenifigens DSM 23921 = NBRC 105050]|uniref:Uncharacterized protein n=1 Tax=Acetobacter nitrogenifigens DSM 23921 = NBRC 105050 TaxID=1120919 RepID=A0A511XDI4_9PROT|nr:hypothetical protein ANI02nite_28970 [Acetobacter nitrogenifigens DSM 23921 = NBRC 105050]
MNRRKQLRLQYVMPVATGKNVRASRALIREWITPYSIGASAPVNSRRMIFIGTNPEDNNPS